MGIQRKKSLAITMMLTGVSLVVLLVSSSHGYPSHEETVTKAASPLINCGCQCSPLTFRDAKGEVQGNCLTVDGTEPNGAMLMLLILHLVRIWFLHKDSQTIPGLMKLVLPLPLDLLFVQ